MEDPGADAGRDREVGHVGSPAARAEVGLAHGRQVRVIGDADGHAEPFGQRVAGELVRPFRRQVRREQQATGLVVDPARQADHGMRHLVAAELGRGGADELDQGRRGLRMPGRALRSPVQHGAVGADHRRSHLGPADVGGQDASARKSLATHVRQSGPAAARPPFGDPGSTPARTSPVRQLRCGEETVPDPSSHHAHGVDRGSAPSGAGPVECRHERAREVVAGRTGSRPTVRRLTQWANRPARSRRCAAVVAGWPTRPRSRLCGGVVRTTRSGSRS